MLHHRTRHTDAETVTLLCLLERLVMTLCFTEKSTEKVILIPSTINSCHMSASVENKHTDIQMYHASVFPLFLHLSMGTGQAANMMLARHPHEMYQTRLLGFCSRCSEKRKHMCGCLNHLRLKPLATHVVLCSNTCDAKPEFHDTCLA